MALAVFHSAAFSNQIGLAPAPGAAIEVRLENGGELADIFEDRDGDTPIGQPGFEADEFGRFTFYAEPVEEGYAITVNNGTESFTLNNVAVGVTSAEVGFAQDGSGGHARTVEEKEREIFSVTDFENTDGTQVNLQGSQDDTTGIQRAVVACEAFGSGAILYFPATTGVLSGKITAPIDISDTIHIIGTGRFTSGIVAYGVNGFNIATGANHVKIESLGIATAVRHSTTPNTLAGISISGTAESQSSGHVFRDVYVDGFRDAVAAAYLYRTRFDAFRCNNGKNGVVFTGTSVDCSVTGSEIVLTGADGIGLGWNDSSSTFPCEAARISDTIILGGDKGIEANFCEAGVVFGCIIDKAATAGIHLRSTASGNSSNWQIVGNHLGFFTGTNGIHLENDFATTSSSRAMGHYIAGNLIRRFTTSNTLTNGILVDGTEDNDNVIIGNRIFATTRDIRIDSGDNNIVAFNQMTGPGFICSVPVNYWMNVGTNAASEANLSDVQNTYTPTLTNVANLDASTAILCFYNRRGNQVTVTGKFNADPTSNTTNTALGISLPIASALAAEQDLAGFAVGGINAEPARIFADATNDRAQVQWTSAGTANAGWSFQFSYLIK